MRIEAEITEAGADGARIWLILQAAGRRIYAEIHTRDQLAMRRLLDIARKDIQSGFALRSTDQFLGVFAECEVKEVGKGMSGVMVATELYACPHLKHLPGRATASLPPGPLAA